MTFAHAHQCPLQIRCPSSRGIGGSCWPFAATLYIPFETEPLSLKSAQWTKRILPEVADLDLQQFCFRNCPNINGFRLSTGDAILKTIWPQLDLPLSGSLMLLQMLEDWSFKKNLIAYNACISTCTRADRWHEVISLFHELLLLRLEPSEVTYSKSVNACEDCGDFLQTAGLLTELRQTVWNSCWIFQALTILWRVRLWFLQYQNVVQSIFSPKRTAQTDPKAGA